MDVQNFRMMQNYKFKEQELDAIINNQNSILQSLREKYDQVKAKDKQKLSSAEKLAQRRKLRSIYTFKLPESKQNETPDDSCQRPQRVQELFKQRHRMIQLGNSYSKNNQNRPLASETISRTGNLKRANELKYKMWIRAKELGNNYSFRFRQYHSKTKCEGIADYYKKHERLINIKEEMEKKIRNSKELKEKFDQNYSHVLNEIGQLEELLGIKGGTYEVNFKFSLEPTKRPNKILRKNDIFEEKLLTELKRPSSQQTDVLNDSNIKLNQVVEKIEITKLLEAAHVVDELVGDAFVNIKESINEIRNVIIDNAMSCKVSELLANSVQKKNSSSTSSAYFSAQQSQNPTPKLSETLKGLCSHFTDDISSCCVSSSHSVEASDSNKHQEDVEIDDAQENSQVPHEICKSELISNSNKADSSMAVEKTNNEIDLGAAEDQQTDAVIFHDNHQANEYTKMGGTDNYIDDIERKLNKLMLHVSLH